jgi:4-amino-4-deoxy-L-arabinose transferase-like glycosyltransferase
VANKDLNMGRSARQPAPEESAQRNVMICRPRVLWIVSVFSVLAFNSIILFVLIPGAVNHIRWSYGTDLYPDGYDQIATNIAQGNGYRFYPETAETLLREPGYPILLAGIFLTFGRAFAAVKLVNMILAFATAYLMMLIARKLSASRLVIFGSPLLFIFYPGTLIAESRGGVEILFAFMLTLFILSVYSAVRKNRWQDYLVTGGVLGVTVLVRSTPILFPFVLFGYLLLFDRRESQRFAILRNFIAMVVTMLLVLSPWIIRNYSLTGRFVPTSTVLGVAAHTGLYLSTHRAVGNVLLDWDAARQRDQLARELGYNFKAGYYQYFYSSADELEFSGYLFNKVVHEYRASPALFIRTVGANLFKFWCGGKTWNSVVMNAMVQLPFLASAIVGVIVCVRSDRARDIAPMVLLILYVVGVSIPILAQARYSEPLTPFLSILACTAFATAQRWFNDSKFTLHQARLKSHDLIKGPLLLQKT